MGKKILVPMMVCFALLALSNQKLFGQQVVPQNGKIAFVSDRDGNQHIYVMDNDGSNVQRLTFSDDSNIFPDWSPDGTRLAFQSRQNDIWGIYIINADGSGLTNLVNGADRYPAWSPDGNFIVFARDTNDGSELYTINVNGENLRKVVDGGDGTYNFFPAWSPDGEQILYVTTDELVGVMSLSTPYFELKTVNVITGEQQMLYALNYEGFPDWSWVRTDESIAITFSGLAGTHIVRLKADGSSTNAKAVTSASNPFSDLSRYTEHPSWSPDGTKIVFDSSDTGSGEGFDYDIYVTDADNEQLVNLTPGTDSDDIMPDWQPIPIAVAGSD